MQQGCKVNFVQSSEGWALINSDLFYLHQAKPLLKKNNVRELVDPFTINYNSRQMNLVLLAASLCIQQSSIRRPCMSQACCLYYSQINYSSYIYNNQLSWN